MADFDFLDSLGISSDQLTEPQSAYERLILEISKQLTDELKDYVKQKAFNKGGLYQGIISFPTGAMSFEIQADQYFKYIDEGVNPVGNKPFSTPYKFNFPRVTKEHAAAIKEWKGYSLKKAYVSAYLTKNKYGIKPRNIIDNVITDDVLERIGNDLATVTGLMFEVKFNKLDEWQ